jgi:hypothetical protein
MSQLCDNAAIRQAKPPPCRKRRHRLRVRSDARGVLDGLITVSPASATNAAAAAVAGQTVPAGASPSARGSMNFQMMTTSGTAKTIPVIAWGLFTAASTDHEKGVVHTFVFPGGTFQLRYRNPIPIASSYPSCLFSGSGVAGTYTLSGGTGKYRGISGSGHLTLNIVGIYVKGNGSCLTGRPPVAYQEVDTASGTASLPRSLAGTPIPVPPRRG